MGRAARAPAASSCGGSCRRTCATRSSSGCRACASGPTGCALRRSSTGRGRARSPTGSSATSSINVRGRERYGIVEPGAEYERVRDEIVERLGELQTPEGERAGRGGAPPRGALRRPRAREDPGPRRRVPRLRLARQGQPDRADADDLGPRHDPRPPEPDATRAATAPRASSCWPGRRAAPARSVDAGIMDVAPTLLYLLGEPIPAALEGRLLAEALDPGCSTSGRPSSPTPRRSRSRRRATTTGLRRPRSRSGCAASDTSSQTSARKPRTSSARVRPAAAAGAAGGVDPSRRGRVELVEVLHERHESARASRRAKSTWWSSTASPWAPSRGTTTGRLPSATAVMIEPTPACATTTRACRT